MSWRVPVILAMCVSVHPAFAHHSFAPHFDASKPVNIAGTVTEYEARNPHSYLHIAAVDENGKTQEYVCESHGVTQLTRNGISREMLAVGTVLRVEGSQSRNNPYMCFFNVVDFGDGRVMNVNGPGAGQPSGSPQTSVQPALPARHDIFGTWLLAPNPNRSTSGPQPMLQFLTPAGERAVAAYDPFRDDPTFRCDPVAIRRVWGAPATPLEIVREDDRVILRHEWMDVERIVYLNMQEHPSDGPRTSLGHSIGHFEDDTLVIETANYSEGVLSQYVEEPGKPTRGLLHSAALTSIERLSFDEGAQRLIVTIDLQDPEFFTRPFATSTTYYAPSDLKIEPFNCSPENQHGSVRE
ncbi:MAG TPA: DUF6152 family protein [Gammaproteobacteria bacterium]|nr:DUF6152 family protein [Gammaproteobacteria bacterium]